MDGEYGILLIMVVPPVIILLLVLRLRGLSSRRQLVKIGGLAVAGGVFFLDVGVAALAPAGGPPAWVLLARSAVAGLVGALLGLGFSCFGGKRGAG